MKSPNQHTSARKCLVRSPCSLQSHTSRGSAMVPLLLLLLLLLLPESLADQVCFNISDGDVHVTVAQAQILDRPTYVTCVSEESPCFFQCTFGNMSCCSEPLVCLEANVTSSPVKEEYSVEQNGTCTLYLCSESAILPLIESLDRSNSGQEDMMRLFNMMDWCAQLLSYREVKKAFINVERRIINNIMGASQVETGGSVSYSLKALSLNVIKISEADLNVPGSSSRIQIAAPQLLPQNGSSIPYAWLPVNALHAIPQERRIIGLVNYIQHSHFQFEQEDISSVVLRIELLGERRLHNLNPTVEIIFKSVTHTHMGNDSWLECRYFDDHDWLWKTDGCETHNRTHDNQTDIICNCNHATPFAVLLIKEPISKVHWQILSHISYIGCGLSAFFTALSLVMYVYSRNHRMDYSISIHASLSGALFLLNSSFLLTEWGPTVKLDWVCVFVAALMHYSLLCCFTWMAIEAIHLYLLLIKVFNSYYKHYLVKLSLAGWGIPGVIVTVSLGVKDIKQFYGVTQLTMADTNQTNAICWITDDTFFYSLNLVYFTVIFIFNSGVLMAVASSICRMKHGYQRNSKLGGEAGGQSWRDPERLSESCRSGLTVLGLTCLMGTTWGLAFLGSGYVNYPILYLFCILNSTQGVFIFLWICLSASKQRKRDDRMTSTPENTSATKSY